MKKIPPKTTGKIRNYVARNPLMGKGGAHVKAKSGERFVDKQKMKREAREWKDSRDTSPFVAVACFIFPQILAGC
ncbi:hypothetical protein [Microbulbifer variabilis]|uniref:hypothetical protein n=1 Tax=Microbulbifer variabilis TaxID=266805 RepID=UPI001CFE52B4|nr:hypothetical protein [Microbulbifer variabilis]